MKSMPELTKYQQLYNEHPEYVELRLAKGAVYEKYLNDVKHWKIKYLEMLVAEHGITNDIDSIVEVGCATGVLLNFFLENHEINRIGIDISDENIKAATELYPHITFSSVLFEEYINVKNLEFKGSLTIMSDVLEHVEDDIGLLRLAGMNSEYVLVNLPIEKVPEYATRIYGIDDIEGHLRAYSVDDAIRMCENAGMEIVSSKVMRYVQEPIFRVNLIEKLKLKYNDKAELILKYIEEINEIDVNYANYKMNFFALLRKKN